MPGLITGSVKEAADTDQGAFKAVLYTRIFYKIRGIGIRICMGGKDVRGIQNAAAVKELQAETVCLRNGPWKPPGNQTG